MQREELLKVEQLPSQGESLFKHFNLEGETTCLEEAIIFDREALELCPSGHPKRWNSLTQLSRHLRNRYNQLGGIMDIEEAMRHGREALELCPRGHQNRVTSLDGLAVDLWVRFRHDGNMADLDEAISFGREALNLYPKSHPDHSKSLNNVANYLYARFVRLGETADLKEAIVLCRKAVNLCAQDDQDRPKFLNNFANHLCAGFERLGGVDQLHEAIVFGKEAIKLRPQGHPDRAISLTNLANHLWTRFRHVGLVVDLNEAVELGREALDLRQQGHLDRAISLNNVSNYLCGRFERLGEVADLNEAIILGREALDLRPHGHPDRAASLTNIANYLSTRFQHMWMMVDLSDAINLGQEALDLRPKGHPDRVASLNNIANYLCARFEQLGETADLNKAIVLGREALDLRPEGHPDRALSLNNVANYLCARFEQLGGTADLNEAIVLGREALDLRPEGHPDRVLSLNNVANYLCARFKHLGEMANLNEAILLGRQALKLLSQGHPNYSGFSNNLAIYLSVRYKALGQMADFNGAILDGREVLALVPPNHPNRADTVNDVAQYLRTRSLRMNQSGDQQDLFNLYVNELARVPQIVCLSHLFAAQSWVNVAEELHHPTTLLAYETSIRLLSWHVATLPSFSEDLSILKQLTSLLTMDAFSACLRNGRPEKSVELLEQGRGLFWNQIICHCSPLDDIISSGPTGKSLANEFVRLASLIHDTLDSPRPGRLDRMRDLSLDMEKVVTNIRNLPGLERFLLPSLFSNLKCAASCGPIIVVNASQYGCDALIVFYDRVPIHIALDTTQDRVRELASEARSLAMLAKTMDTRRDLGCLLRELWNIVVSPIVNFLRTTLPTGSRIWWCPTAEFSALPLHAAGPYRRGEQNLSHLYISSYTPTLSALMHARRQNPSHLVTKEKRFVGIGQVQTNGENELVSVCDELDIVGQRLKGLATFTRVEGQNSHMTRVSEELAKNEWAHFACHGLLHREHPLDSAFALHDGRFTIQRIITCELENAEFAYLSACHTTIGDDEISDEVIHLASVMQLTGFRSVIGTMWAVDDAQTNEIVSVFYGNMVDESGHLDYTRAAFALNKTMHMVDIPFDQQVLYVHIGT